MIGPSGRRYEVNASQCVRNFFRGLSGARATYGEREYSQYYKAGNAISATIYVAILLSPLWGGGMLIGFLIGRSL